MIDPRNNSTYERPFTRKGAKLRELDLLKSIFETDQGNETAFLSGSLSNSGRLSRMGDNSSQPEDYIRHSLPLGNRTPGRPKSAKGGISCTKESENNFIKVNVNTRSDSGHSDYQEYARLDTIRLQHGINYTPLVQRSPRSRRRVTSTKIETNKARTKRCDPLLYKYAELRELLSDDGPNSKKRPVLDANLTRKAQQLMFEYKLAQSGQIPVAWLNAREVLLPSIGKAKGKEKKSKLSSAIHASRQTSTLASQTFPYEGSEDERYHDDYQGMFIIDTNTYRDLS